MDLFGFRTYKKVARWKGTWRSPNECGILSFICALRDILIIGGEKPGTHNQIYVYNRTDSVTHSLRLVRDIAVHVPIAF
jgi:hypothetical protein